jgi:hypothetical protein
LLGGEQFLGLVRHGRCELLELGHPIARLFHLPAAVAPFSEDRGLLPADTIGHTYAHADPYNPRPIWENFRGLFHAIDKGNPRLSIPAYNGGLFAPDGILDSLEVPDEVCACLRDLAAYDYRPDHEADGLDIPYIPFLEDSSLITPDNWKTICLGSKLANKSPYVYLNLNEEVVH